MSNPDDPAAWLAKAGNDLQNIDNNLRGERIPWDTVCFHAQQAAEKALKAILAARGVLIPRTPDLLMLLSDCAASGCPLVALGSDAYFLNPFSVAYRYPGAGPDPDAETAARRVVDTVRAILAK